MNSWFKDIRAPPPKLLAVSLVNSQINNMVMSPPTLQQKHFPAIKSLAVCFTNWIGQYCKGIVFTLSRYSGAF